MTRVATEYGPWVRCYEPRPAATARIVCFGPAGGTAGFFRGWSRAARDDVEVWSLAYPGRERRIDEAPPRSMEQLARTIADELAQRLDRPTAFFGHSMGATVAYEVTRLLEGRGHAEPSLFVASARGGPRLQRDDTADLSDAEIVERLRRLGGTPDEVLDDPDMRAAVIPPVRTDFDLLGRYHPDPDAARLATPVAVVYADADRAAPPAAVRAWLEITSAPAGERSYRGSHFYCLAHESDLVAHVGALLTEQRPRPRRTSPMPTAPRYHARTLPLSGDALEIGSALAASSTLPNVLYERHGDVGWAEGDQVMTERAGDGPVLARTRALVAALGQGDWRAYGWAGFELAHALHGCSAPTEGTPFVRLLIPDREVRIADGAITLRARDAEDLDRLEDRIRSGLPTAQPGARRFAETDLDGDGAAAYEAGVANVVREIRAGRLEKAILSRVVPVPVEIDLPATYLAGRRANAPARSFLLSMDGLEAAGFCPEIVVHVSSDGIVTTQPLAGTRALTGDPDGDGARRAELRSDAKEVFEHAISVRLAAEELEAVCAAGSVRVEQFMEVEERGSVLHLASRLTGRVGADSDGWDAFAALFPAVTASGIPKAAACELIARHETERRGLYSGAVLTVDGDGTIDAALVLRSVYRQDGRTWLRAGAGIVAASDPARELEETREKLRSVAPHLVAAEVARAAGPATVGSLG